MVPVLIFNLSSFYLLAFTLQAQAADGSGTMTVDDDSVTAGASGQVFKFTFDPSEDMDGGSVRVTIPSGWPSAQEGDLTGDGDIEVEGKSGAVIGDVNVSGGDEIEIDIDTMSANEYFTLKYNVDTIPTVADDYDFTTESKLAGGSFDDLSDSRQASVEIEPAAVDFYDITKTDGTDQLSDQIAGVDFDVLVTAYDEYDNVTTGSASVAITASDDTTGTLSGETSADTSSDGTDTITLNYSKPVTDLTLIPDDVTADESTAFDVVNIADPVISLPASSTNDSTPLIDWGSIEGTGVEYNVVLKEKESGVDCDDNDYDTDLLVDEDTGSTSQYQLTSAQALLDETTYCIEVAAEDDNTNESFGYKEFRLLTAKPATSSAETIEDVGDETNYGHPADTINIYNVDSVDVKVTHSTGLDGGEAYVEIEDGLGNKATGNTTIANSGDTTTTVTGIDASSLQQGNLTAKARVEDAGGNSSDWSSGSTFVKDTNPPAKPTAVTFLDDPVNISNEATVNIQVSGESGADAYYSISTSGAGGPLTGDFNMSSGTTDSSDIDTGALGDGTLTASVYLIDTAWNHSSTKEGTVTKDATAPTVTFSTTVSDPTNTSPIPVTAEFSEDVTGFESGDVTLGNGSIGNFSGSGRTYTFEVTPSGNGSVTVDVAADKAIDVVGNNNTAATQLSVTYDGTKPSLSEKTAVTTPTSDTTPDYVFTSDEAGSITYGGSCSSSTTSAISGDNSITFDTLSDRSYSDCTITVTDAAGNVSDTLAVSTFVIDTTGPSLSFDNNVEEGPVASDTITGNWSGADAAVKKWKYNDNTTCSTTAGDYTDGTTIPDQTDETNNGKYICLYGEDALGNKSTLASANDINIDSTDPVVDTISSPAESNNQTFTVSYTASDTGSGVEFGRLYYKLDGGSWTQYDIASADDYQTYPGSFSFTAPQPGTYDFYIQAKDGVGNESTLQTPTDTTVAVPTTVYVDDDYTSGGANDSHAWNWDAFDTIANGINAVKAEGTVNVAAGTYDEQVTIDKSLTLNGAGDSTIYQPSAVPSAGVYDMKINTDDVTVQNFLFDFNGGGDDRSGNGIVVSDLNGPSATGVTIQNNKIYPGDANTGIQTGKNADITDLLITGNTFYGDATGSSEGIYINPTSGTGIVVSNNTFSGYLYSGVSIETGNVTVSGNSINSDSQKGVYGIRYIDLTGGQTYSGVSITDNTIQNVQHGIRIGTSADDSSSLTATIFGNTISNCDNGVIAKYGAHLTLTDKNSIHTNTKNVVNENSSQINAEENWWGSNQFSTINSSMTGDVDFDPWYMESGMTSLSSGDTTGPTVVLSDDLSGRTQVKSGDTVNITATFSDANGLDTGVTPTITINNGGVTDVAMTGTGDIWTYAWTVPGGDASATVTVSAKDIVGNDNQVATGTTSYTIDNTAPSGYSVPIDTVINNSNKTNFSFTFSGAELGATYNYSIDSDGGGTTVSGSGTISTATDNISGIDVSGLNDGTLTLTVYLTDPAGNQGGDATDTKTKDVVAPTLSSVNIASNNATNTAFAKVGNDVVITFTASETLNGNPTATIDGNAAIIATTGNPNEYTATYTMQAGDNQGTLAFTIDFTDATGNAGTQVVVTTNSSSVTFDETNPVVNLDELTPDPNNNNSANITGSATDERTILTAIEYRYSSDGGSNWSGWSGVTIDDSSLDETSEDFNFNLPGVVDGNYQLEVRATDSAGNQGIDTDTFEIDTTGPTVTDGKITVTGDTGDNSYFKKGDDIDVAWDNTAGGDNNDDVANVTFDFSQFDGGATVAGINTGDVWTASYTLPDGVYYAGKTVSVTAVDDATNSTTQADGGSYNADTIDPVVNAGSDQVKNAQFDQDATVTDDTALTYAWSKTSGSGTVTFGAQTSEDTSVSADADDNYVIRLTATDAAGNSAYDEFNLTWDQSDPTSSASSPTYDIAGNINVTFTTGADLSGVVNVELWKKHNSGAWASTGMNSASTSGTFEFTPADGDGIYYFATKATDNAGNSESDPSGDGDDNTIYDLTNPTAPSNFAVTSGAPYNTWTNTTDVEISWDASTDATSGLRGFGYKWDKISDTDLQDSMTPGDGSTWEEDESVTTNSTAFTSDGEWYFHIQPRDEAGNYRDTTHYGPFKIDTTDPSGSHSAVDEETAGVDIDVDLTGVSDAGSGIASVTVDYKYHGDSSYTSDDMTDDGGGTYSFSIPDEENSEYDVDYHIKITDNAGNETRFPSSGDHTVDIVPAGIDHFTFIYPTSGTRYAGTWFTAVVEGRDQYNNLAENFEGTGDTVNFTTDEGSVSVFVQETGTNESGIFDNGVWAGQIQFGEGGGITPSGNDIILTASDSDDAGRNGSTTMTTSGSDFGTTMSGASVEGVQDGAEVGSEGGAMGGEGVTSEGGVPVVEGEKATQGEGSQASIPASSPWREYLPWAVGVAALIFLGGGIKWLINRNKNGSGGGSISGMVFSMFKNLATKIRIFFW